MHRVALLALSLMRGRRSGYDTSLGYFHHDNDYFTDMDRPFVDLWDTMVRTPEPPRP